MLTTKAVRRTVEEVWEKTEQEFLFPFLSSEAVEQTGLPARLIKNQILLNIPFIMAMARIGVEPRTSISLLFAREVNAWLRIPQGAREYIWLYGNLRQVVYSERVASRLLQAYLDIWNDLDLYYNQGKTKELVRVYRVSIGACGSTAEDNFYRVLAGTLAAKTGTDLGITLAGVHRTLVDQLARLSYLKPADRGEEIRQFGLAISKIFFFKTVSTTRKGGVAGSGSASGAKAQEEKPEQPRWPLGQNSVRDLGSMSGLEGAIGRFAGEMHDTKTFDLLLEAFSRLGGQGIATTRFQTGRWFYYRELSKKYPLEILRREAQQSAPSFPVDLTNWTPEDDPLHTDFFASLGLQATPGITQRRRFAGGESQYHATVFPDLIIIIDSSSSMVHPNKATSYAVLGGFVAARPYLANGSEIAVYNFSSSDLVLNFTRNEPKIYQHIAACQWGGTVLNDNILDSLIRNRERLGREVDVLLITDMGISGVDRAIQKLRNCEKMHRVFLFLVGGNPATVHEQFAGSKVKIYALKNNGEFPNLVLGAVKESFESVKEGTNAG